MPFADVAKPSNGDVRTGNRQCPSWVSLRKARNEHMISGMPLIAAGSEPAGTFVQRQKRKLDSLEKVYATEQ